MYATTPFDGSHLPEKTLCLTFDDGPGAYTQEIAEYLHEQGISATFFVVGKYAIERTETLEKLVNLNHIVGNHTYEHPDLPYYVSIGGDLQNQVLRTDAIISKYCNEKTFFRAPYGKWSAEVANDLNANLLATQNHFGPIHWDISGVDCYYWQLNKSVEEAVEIYLQDIREKKKGIVVFHDDIADMDVVKWKTQTHHLVKKLIPVLLNEGYRFVSLHDVFKNDISVFSPLCFYLISSKGKFISINPEQFFEAKTKNPESATALHIEAISEGKYTLQTNDKKFISASENSILYLKNNLSEEGKFDLIPVADNRIIFRCFTGNFIAINKEGKLHTDAKYMRLAEVFAYKPIDFSGEKKFTFSMKLKLWKKRIAFIKSKLLSR